MSRPKTITEYLDKVDEEDLNLKKEIAALIALAHAVSDALGVMAKRGQETDPGAIKSSIDSIIEMLGFPPNPGLLEVNKLLEPEEITKIADQEDMGMASIEDVNKILAHFRK